jgi:hypothetical protein
VRGDPMRLISDERQALWRTRFPIHEGWEG